MNNYHTLKRISGLEGLRALAALAVFGVHFNQIVQFDYKVGFVDIYTLLANGDHGVSLFFSLSGFLLGIPFWKAIISGEPLPRLKVYTIRRLARIMPAYYVTLTILIILSGLWRVPGSFVDIFLHYTFLFNFTEFSIFSINKPFWTVAVEVQFYILLPFIFMLIRKLSSWMAITALCLIGGGAYTAHYYLMNTVSSILPWPYSPWLTWIRPYGAVLHHSLLANLPIFLLGFIAGYLFLWIKEQEDKHQEKIQWVSECVFWVCLIGIFLMINTGLEDSVRIPCAPYGFPVVPLLITIVIIAAPFSSVANRCLDSFPLRLLGIISYGIYLYHVPCLNWTCQYMSRFGFNCVENWIIFGTISIAVTIIIATVSYLTIEKTILRLVRKKF